MSRLHLVWNKEMETFFNERSYSFANGPMKFWECLLSNSPFWWKVKKIQEGRGPSALILTHFSTCPTNSMVSRRGRCPWPWEVRVHSVILTCFSTFRGYRLIGFGGWRFQNSPRPKTQHFEVNSILPGSMWPMLSWWWAWGWGCGKWLGGNKSKFLWNDLTGNDTVSASYHPMASPPRGSEPAWGRSPS